MFPPRLLWHWVKNYHSTANDLHIDKTVLFCHQCKISFHQGSSYSTWDYHLQLGSFYISVLLSARASHKSWTKLITHFSIRLCVYFCQYLWRDTPSFFKTTSAEPKHTRITSLSMNMYNVMENNLLWTLLCKQMSTLSPFAYFWCTLLRPLLQPFLLLFVQVPTPFPHLILIMYKSSGKHINFCK